MPNTTDTNSSTTPTPASPTNYIAAIDHNVAVGQVQPIQSPTSNANAKANVFGIKDWSRYSGSPNSSNLQSNVEYYSEHKQVLTNPDFGGSNLTVSFIVTAEILTHVLILADDVPAFRKEHSVEYNRERKSLLDFYTKRLKAPQDKAPQDETLQERLQKVIQNLEDSSQDMIKPRESQITPIPPSPPPGPPKIPEGNKSKRLKYLSYGLFATSVASGATAGVSRAIPMAVSKISTELFVAAGGGVVAAGATAAVSKYVEKTEKAKLTTSSPKP